MKLLSLSINGQTIPTIPGIPSGGLDTTGKNIVQVTLNLLVLVGIIMALVFILYSGIQWILSGGEKQKLEQARHRLTYSIVGLLVIVLSFFIVNTVLTLIGANPKFFLNTP